jgi:hypothetical protein
MRHLHGLQILIATLLVCCSLPGFAQHNKGNHNFREFNDKAYYFGLTFGYNKSNFQLAHSKRFILNDSFNITEGLGGPGLNVSMVTNMKLGEYFDFRFLPGFSFVGRKLYYLGTHDEIEQERSIESVLIQAPFQVRFKSEPFHDMRVFVLAGVKYTYDVASNAEIRREQAQRILRVSPHDYSIELGGGMQFFFPFFIFSPEIKYSQGIGNILIYNKELAKATVLEKILSRTFTISLHFEG